MKQIISLEKLYLCKPKTCQIKLETLLKNNHILLKVPSIQQLTNYCYKHRSKLIAESYPQIKQYLTEICEKSYSEELKEDEMFYIYSSFQSGDVSILFSTPMLIKNLIKQAQLQPAFIHLDGTYKLIDLGLPVLTLATENVDHNFRPVAFLVASGETKQQINLMLSKLYDFLLTHFSFAFLPRYILSDNSDAIIGGCQTAFSHEYTHLLCHFHILKRLKEKTQSKDLKDFKSYIMFGVKMLKNSQTLVIFQHFWTLIRQYWTEKGIPEKFIKNFEIEYIRKKVQWHYGSAFNGKSRSNNSVESGNKVLKDFFNRKPQNLKEFLCKIRDFLREWSTIEKTSFPMRPAYKNKMKIQAKNIAQNETFLKLEQTPQLLYFFRKGIEIKKTQLLLQKVLTRKLLPKNINELFEGWGIFRTFNVLQNTCDCSDFCKYNYCKHFLAMKILNEELNEPEINSQKKRGRKKQISKALEK